MKGSFNLLTYLVPKLRDVFFTAILVSAVLLGPRMLNVDGDLGRHITIGEVILDQGRVPTSDIFSHSMDGETLTPHEWLAQVIFASAHRVLGLAGVVFLTALVLALAFYFVLQTAATLANGLPLLSLGVTILAAAASSLHWLTRPHIFTILLCAVWLYQLEKLRTARTHKWWAFPLLMLAWVNLHGAFIAGFVILGLILTGELWDYWSDKNDNPLRIRSLRLMALAGLSSFAVSFLNPAGGELWSTSIGYLRNEYLVSHTQEYLPPNFHDSSTLPFLLMIVLLIVFLGYSQQKLPAGWLLLVAAWTGMGLYSVRNVPLFSVAAAPALAFAGALILQDNQLFKSLKNIDLRLIETEKSLKGWLWPFFTVILVGILLYNQQLTAPDQSKNRFDPVFFPVAAVDWLETHPQKGNVFNYFPWGGYLLYRDWPQTKVFIDGQTDFYGEELTRKYERVILVDDGWQDVLASYDVEWVIMPTESVLVEQLGLLSQWEMVYKDSTAAILIREPRGSQ